MKKKEIPMTDLLEELRQRAQRAHGNPYPEGTQEYRAFTLGWDMGRMNLVSEVTSADPKKLAAAFTGQYILMRPDMFQKRLESEREAMRRILSEQRQKRARKQSRAAQNEPSKEKT